MSRVSVILEYQKIDAELFNLEREFKSNPENIKFVKAAKKVKSMQEVLKGFEEKAKVLLDKFNSLLAEKETYKEEKVQIEKTIDETSEVVAVDYLKNQISILASKMDTLKSSIQDLENDIKFINKEYIAFAKEIKEAKEFGVGYKETYEKEKNAFETKKKEIEQKLAKLEGEISKEFLEKYKAKRLEPKVRFPLVRGCNGTHCSLCGVELSIVAKNNISESDVIECENCRKFVYLEK